MARTKAVLGTGARLADYLSASLLARVIPAQVVNEVLDAHGRNTQRLRSFPAVVGVYYTVARSACIPRRLTRKYSRPLRKVWRGRPGRASPCAYPKSPSATPAPRSAGYRCMS